MQGYQLTFFTQVNHTHQHQSLADWLIREVRRLGLRGATLIPGAEGLGHEGKVHSVHFFELADQPQIVTVVASAEEVDRLLSAICAEGIKVFYVKTPAEFGFTCGE